MTGQPISIRALRENAWRNLDEALSRNVLIQPDKLLALVEAVEAADRYVNWHKPRIAPTAAVPDSGVALHEARIKLARFSFERPDQGER